MWGNVRGWIISALMLAASAGFFYVVAMPPAESAPLGLVPGAYQAVAMKTDPGTIVPPGTKDCDAGDLYQQAIEDYLKNPKPYESAARDEATLPGVDLLLQAADCGQMKLFEKHPDKIINYDKEKPWVSAMTALAHAADDVGLRVRDKSPDEAKKYYQAAFAAGEKMLAEQVAWPEVTNALSIMQESATAMAKLADNAHDSARVDQLSHFADECGNYRTDLQEKIASPLGNPAEEYSSKYAGDIFAVAKNDKAPRLWRVEATLHLGHYRWMVASERKGDQAWSEKELNLLSASPDPVIRTAVKAAQGLTEQQQLFTGS